MSELPKPREVLSVEKIKQNFDAFLLNVVDTVIERGSEKIKISLVFIVETGMHINCYFKDGRKIESIGRHSESPDAVAHDKSHPFAIHVLSAAIGNSANTMQLRSFRGGVDEERISEISLSNPKIINNMVFRVEQD